VFLLAGPKVTDFLTVFVLEEIEDWQKLTVVRNQGLV
jgi:hypothetical protein